MSREEPTIHNREMKRQSALTLTSLSSPEAKNTVHTRQEGNGFMAVTFKMF